MKFARIDNETVVAVDEVESVETHQDECVIRLKSGRTLVSTVSIALIAQRLNDASSSS